jgi:hypothetical protein
MSAPLTSIGEQVRDVRPGLWVGGNGRQPIRRNLAAGPFAALDALLVGYSACPRKTGIHPRFREGMLFRDMRQSNSSTSNRSTAER